jgi:hypothetical protein
VLWFLIWFVLVVAAVGVLTVLGVHLYRQAKALTAELAAASDRLGEISAAIAHSAPAPRD